MKKLNNLILLILLLIFVSSCEEDTNKTLSNGPFKIISINNNYEKSEIVKLRQGDLLFLEEGTGNDFINAITSSTISVNNYNFSHVGVAYFEKNQWYVIEAIPSGVSKNKIEDFLKPFTYKTKDTIKSFAPTVIVGRVKSKYAKIIPSAINNIKKLIGKPYDFYFNANNDSLYCSELIQQNYIYNKKPLFSPIKMTFKDSTGKIGAYWISLFKKLKTKVPEGALGSNPGELSTSDKIDIIGGMKLDLTKVIK